MSKKRRLMPTAEDISEYEKASEWIKDWEAKAAMLRCAPFPPLEVEGFGTIAFYYFKRSTRLCLNGEPAGDLAGKTRVALVERLEEMGVSV